MQLVWLYLQFAFNLALMSEVLLGSTLVVPGAIVVSLKYSRGQQHRRFLSPSHSFSKLSYTPRIEGNATYSLKLQIAPSTQYQTTNTTTAVAIVSPQAVETFLAGFTTFAIPVRAEVGKSRIGLHTEYLAAYLVKNPESDETADAPLSASITYSSRPVSVTNLSTVPTPSATTDVISPHPTSHKVIPFASPVLRHAFLSFVLVLPSVLAAVSKWLLDSNLVLEVVVFISVALATLVTWVQGPAIVQPDLHFSPSARPLVRHVRDLPTESIVRKPADYSISYKPMATGMFVFPRSFYITTFSEVSGFLTIPLHALSVTLFVSSSADTAVERTGAITRVPSGPSKGKKKRQRKRKNALIKDNTAAQNGALPDEKTDAAEDASVPSVDKPNTVNLSAAEPWVIIESTSCARSLPSVICQGETIKEPVLQHPVSEDYRCRSKENLKAKGKNSIKQDPRLGHIIDMGFSVEDAEAALAMNPVGGDVEEVINWLLNQSNNLGSPQTNEYEQYNAALWNSAKEASTSPVMPAPAPTPFIPPAGANHASSSKAKSKASKERQTKSTLTNSRPIKWTDGRKIIIGLQNPRNYCYMNATMQCLASTTPFAEVFLALDSSSPILSNSTSGAFATLLKDMRGGASSRSLNLNGFRNRWIRRDAPYFDNAIQHDAHEYLVVFLSLLQRDLTPMTPRLYEPVHQMDYEVTPQQIGSAEAWRLQQATENSIVAQMFGGLYRDQLTCQRCNATSTKYHKFEVLTASIPSGVKEVSVQECLETTLMEKETMDDWKCHSQYCNDERNCSKSIKTLTLARLPPILVIHVKRFTPCFKSDGYKKDRTSVTYPLKSLELTSFMPPDLPKDAEFETICAQSAAPSKLDVQAGPYKYDLFATTCHRGDSMNNGHYISYVLSNGKWFLADDARVSQVSEREAMDTTAYLLFYRRVD